MVTWNCPPRTRAKLKILDHYLGAWFSIIAVSNFRTALYFDGFAGPGEYTSGELGSPLIALRHANNVCLAYPNFRPVLIFNEVDQKHYQHCLGLIEKADKHPNISWHIINSDFMDIANSLHQRLEGRWNNPILSFVDPFGIKNCGFRLVSKLLSYQRSECFINSMVGWANRFIDHQEAGLHVADLLGGEHVNDVLGSPDRIGRIIEIYESKLRDVVPYVRKFQMRDEGNVRDNILIFAGRHPKGFIKMKEAMWSLDPEHGNRFSAKTELLSESLPDLFRTTPTPQTSELRRLIPDFIRAQQNVSVSKIISYVEPETDFIGKHVRPALNELYEKQVIEIVRQANISRVNAWPPEMVLSLR
jgi:three-Cys-motif partner protein